MDSELRSAQRRLDSEPSVENLDRLDAARRRVGDGPWLPARLPVTRWVTVEEMWTELSAMVGQISTMRYWIERSFAAGVLPTSASSIPDPE